MAACVGTWSFGQQAVEAASRILSAGGSCIDSLERGVNGRRIGILYEVHSNCFTLQ